MIAGLLILLLGSAMATRLQGQPQTGSVVDPEWTQSAYVLAIPRAK
jgi:hypothetical protein